MRPVKYDTVIGTIGNTHGVSSDSAPIAAASHRYAPKVLARDDARDPARVRAGQPTFGLAGGWPRADCERVAFRSDRPGLCVAGVDGVCADRDFYVSSTSFGGRHSLSLHV